MFSLFTPFLSIFSNFYHPTIQPSVSNLFALHDHIWHNSAFLCFRLLNIMAKNNTRGKK
jgi:hypothetical protein